MLRYLLLLCCLFPLAAHAADTRGLRVVAKDPASDQTGEVQLYNKSYAVIIGIDRYKNLSPDRQLKNAVKDARGIEATLKKQYRFDRIFTLHDQQASRDAIMRLLTAELPGIISKDDALFIFWAGHGNQVKTHDGDLGYLIPYDGNSEGIYGNITMSQLKDDISRAIPAKHIFYAFDACYSGLLTTRAVDRTPRRDLSYLKNITNERVRQILTAGSKGQEALDGGPRGHSVFTGRLIEVLEATGDYITANELQSILKERVYQDARARGHEQTPGFGALYGGGDFVFIPVQQNRLGDITATSAARQKELEQLKKAEAEAAAAKQKEQQELARKQAELDALGRQIAEMKSRLGSGTARATDSLDTMVALVEQKEAQAKRLEELNQQRETEEHKRLQELEYLKQAAETKRLNQIKTDVAKYQKVAASSYGQELKGTAWDALISSYPAAKEAERYNIDAFLTGAGGRQRPDTDQAAETATGRNLYRPPNRPAMAAGWQQSRQADDLAPGHGVGKVPACWRLHGLAAAHQGRA
ncbi:MAG: caspase family protein [Trichlorobacter sp.]